MRVLYIISIFFMCYGLSVSADIPDSTAPAIPAVYPDSLSPLLSVDSTVLEGSDYSTFADILNTLPGIYYFNPRSTGLPAPVSLFGSSPGHYTLEYDGLLLNDPITNKADLLLIPPESMGAVKLTQNLFQDSPVGQTIRVSGHDRSFVPLHSKIAYRPGNYDSNYVDVRVGVQINPTLKLNAGAMTRLFTGVMSNSFYRSEIWNAKIDKYYKQLSLGYVWFQYRDHQHFPLPASVPGWESIRNPHRKRYRTEHAFFIRFTRHLQASVQASLYHRQDLAQDRSQLDQSHHVQRYYLKTSYQNKIKSIQYQVGGFSRIYHFKSDVWQACNESRSGGWLQITKNSKNLSWQAGTRFKSIPSDRIYFLPQMSLQFATGAHSVLTAYAGQRIIAPSIEERYGMGPFANGNDTLQTGQLSSACLNWQIVQNRFRSFISIAAEYRKNIPATTYQDNLIRYINIDEKLCTSLDVSLYRSLARHWSTEGRITIYQNMSDSDIIANRPNVYSRFVITFQHSFFQKDLNIKFRLGGEYIGERNGPIPVYSDYSDLYIRLSPRFVPYLHLSAAIGSADLFISLENAVGQEYQQVYGFDAPKSLVRYGLVWTFDN